MFHTLLSCCVLCLSSPACVRLVHSLGGIKAKLASATVRESVRWLSREVHTRYVWPLFKFYAFKKNANNVNWTKLIIRVYPLLMVLWLYFDLWQCRKSSVSRSVHDGVTVGVYLVSLRGSGVLLCLPDRYRPASHQITWRSRSGITLVILLLIYRKQIMATMNLTSSGWWDFCRFCKYLRVWVFSCFFSYRE